jgi:hypothetical protein
MTITSTSCTRSPPCLDDVDADADTDDEGFGNDLTKARAFLCDTQHQARIASAQMIMITIPAIGATPGLEVPAELESL